MGEVPSWYPVMSAARYMKVPVWELQDAPTVWVYRAHAAMKAEDHAREMHEKMG
jgi:hypothetical protein